MGNGIQMRILVTESLPSALCTGAKIIRIVFRLIIALWTMIVWVVHPNLSTVAVILPDLAEKVFIS